MKKQNLMILLLVLAVPLSIWAQCGMCKDGCMMNENAPDGQLASAQVTQAVQLPGYNKAKWIDENHYFTYSFAKKPKLGMATLIVKVYNKNKKLVKDYEVFANSDMPSMKGAHASGDVKLKPNKKGELMVPINFVMPGVWQVDLKFSKSGKNNFNGYFTVKI